MAGVEAARGIQRVLLAVLVAAARGPHTQLAGRLLELQIRVAAAVAVLITHNQRRLAVQAWSSFLTQTLTQILQLSVLD